ncbi:hypothetical protein [Pseudomonas sp. HMWF021]|uniref:hypothetical protein n=1 Tax=Pseudomonas sp. HMWF021 TaxID=2056857 RepID=UPI0011B1F22E|nr:hypothetical protein [Pseudomonas sp. HMWF021]
MSENTGVTVNEFGIYDGEATGSGEIRFELGGEIHELRDITFAIRMIHGRDGPKSIQLSYPSDIMSDGTYSINYPDDDFWLGWSIQIPGAGNRVKKGKMELTLSDNRTKGKGTFEVNFEGDPDDIVYHGNFDVVQ